MFSRQSMSSDQRALERQYDDHLNEAIQAALRGNHEDATLHSGVALSISRKLYESSGDPARHRPALAAALYNHAGNLGRDGANSEALTLLAESAEHYRALASEDPAEFGVRNIDVLVRTGLAIQASGDVRAAAERFRSAISQYPGAPATDLVERDLGLARAHFFLGRCLLSMTTSDDALAEIDSGLVTAERVRLGAGIPAATDFFWLATAPRSFQLIAPDWIAAAVCAMELHDAAGRWDVAADAANIAVRVSGGMGAMSSAGFSELYDTILARAKTIWEHAQDPARAAIERAAIERAAIERAARARPGRNQGDCDWSSPGFVGHPDLEAIFRATGWVVPG
jgi:tetratricopeptide (TPR) repeat protein